MSYVTDLKAVLEEKIDRIMEFAEIGDRIGVSNMVSAAARLKRDIAEAESEEEAEAPKKSSRSFAPALKPSESGTTHPEPAYAEGKMRNIMAEMYEEAAKEAAEGGVLAHGGAVRSTRFGEIHVFVQPVNHANSGREDGMRKQWKLNRKVIAGAKLAALT